MRSTITDIEDVRAHFLDKDGGSLATLNDQLGAGIRLARSWHNHAIFLYHATKNALSKELYGRNVDAAADVIRGHIRDWTDKALAWKTPPEPWIIPQTLTAFTMLQVRPPAKYVELCQNVASKHLSRYNKGEILDWFGAAADLTLEYKPDFLQKICARVVTHAPTIPGYQLYNLAHHMAIMDAVAVARGGPRLSYIADAFGKIFNHPVVKAEVERVRHKEEWRKMADARYWFANEKAAFSLDETERKSVLEFKVAEQFKAAGAKVIRRSTVRDVGHTIDLSFNFNGCSFDVEVDGPYHFVRSTGGQVLSYDGTTIFQTLMICAKHPDKKVVRLPYTVYHDYSGNQKAWADLCKAISEAPSGAMMVTSDLKLSRNLLTRCNVSAATAAADADLHRRMNTPAGQDRSLR